MSVWIHTWCQRRIYSFPTDSATTGESELCARPALFKKTFSNNTFDGNFSTWKTSSVDGPALTYSAVPHGSEPACFLPLTSPPPPSTSADAPHTAPSVPVTCHLCARCGESLVGIECKQGMRWKYPETQLQFQFRGVNKEAEEGKGARVSRCACLLPRKCCLIWHFDV